MISVSIELLSDSFSCVCQGHANFAEYGKDIVCASVSTLVQYVCFTLAYKYNFDFEIKDGFLAFSLLNISMEDRVWAESFIDCLLSIENQAPDHLKIDIVRDEASNT